MKRLITEELTLWRFQAVWFRIMALSPGGKDTAQFVYHAVVMEKVAEMDIKALLVNPQSNMLQYVLDKHYFRKHGANAYYGQK